jgi:chromosome segregation ATPase
MFEQLTYAQIGERLNISSEGARAIVKRNRLPRSHGNDGRTLVSIDLDELRHKPLPARSSRGQPVTEALATLKARIEQLEAELAAEQQRSAGHRADYERERERADQLVTTQDRIIGELKNLRSLLQLAQQAARPVTTRTWRDVAWGWLRTAG